MIITDAIPNKGQFVALWFTDEGLPFSSTLKWEGGKLKSYNPICDTWEHVYSREFFDSLDINVTFYY